MEVLVKEVSLPVDLLEARGEGARLFVGVDEVLVLSAPALEEVARFLEVVHFALYHVPAREHMTVDTEVVGVGLAVLQLDIRPALSHLALVLAALEEVILSIVDLPPAAYALAHFVVVILAVGGEARPGHTVVIEVELLAVEVLQAGLEDARFVGEVVFLAVDLYDTLLHNARLVEIVGVPLIDLPAREKMSLLVEQVGGVVYELHARSAFMVGAHDIVCTLLLCVPAGGVFFLVLEILLKAETYRCGTQRRDNGDHGFSTVLFESKSRRPSVNSHISTFFPFLRSRQSISARPDAMYTALL